MNYNFDYNNRDFDKDLYLPLSYHSESLKLKNAFKDYYFTSNSIGKYSVRSISQREKAFLAYSFDLLQVRTLGSDEWGYRSFRRDDFTGKRVGYKPFKWVHDSFKSIGFIEQVNGFHDRQGDSGHATRVRPTLAFLEFMLGHGITPDNFRSHFTLVDDFDGKVIDPVRVRASKTGDWYNPKKGARLPVDSNDPNVAFLIDQVQKLNEWFSKHRLEHPTEPGPMFAGLYRLFNQGDRDDFAYNKGGRLYCFGSYQQIKRDKRPALLIDGESVVEIDVSASHPTILHAMMKSPLLPSFDPYIVPGITSRTVVKMFITMTLGNGRFQKSWPKECKIRYLRNEMKIDKKDKEYSKEELALLQKVYPLREVRASVLNSLPVLDAFPESGISWADLQYRESLGLISAIETLAYVHGVPAYPLHDSVIVPASKAELAKQVLEDAFWKHANVRIRVTAK